MIVTPPHSNVSFGAAGGVARSDTRTGAAQQRVGNSGVATYIIRVKSANVPVPAPPVFLDPSQQVEVWPLPGNTATVTTGDGPNAAVGGPFNTAQMPAAAAQIITGISNLSQIWVNGTIANDGVLLRVVRL